MRPVNLLALAVLFLYFPALRADNGACVNPTIPVYNWTGFVEGFPMGIVLYPNNSSTQTYAICYPYGTGLITMQYTLQQSTSLSIDDAFNQYAQLLTRLGWTIAGTLQMPGFDAASALKGDSHILLTVSVQSGGSYLVLSYVSADEPPPTNLSAVAGSGQVQLHWATPEVVPNSLSLFTYSVGASGPVLVNSQSLVPTATNTLVSGLANGQLYKFQITATGEQGQSLPAELYAKPASFAAPAHPPYPILLLHGINADSTAWDNLARYLSGTLHWNCGGTLSYIGDTDPASNSPLENDPSSKRTASCGPTFNLGGDFFTQNFGNPLANYLDGQAIYHQGAEVGGYLQALQSRGKFSVVGWSMGGLAARAYIRRSPYSAAVQIDDFTTLGTPHWGVDLPFLRIAGSVPALPLGLFSTLWSDGASAMNGGCVANGDSSNYALLSPFLYDIDTSASMPPGIRYTSVTGKSVLIDDECAPTIQSQPSLIWTDEIVPAPSSTFAGILPSYKTWFSLDSARLHTDLPSDTANILCGLFKSCTQIAVHSPVDIQVTAPDGNLISSTFTSIPGAEYQSVPEDDGHIGASVVIPFPMPGNYSITAIPKSDASPNDTYTITVTQNGVTTTVADAIPIQSIPQSGYQLHVNAAPMANAGQPQTIERHGCDRPWIMLDGSASSDPNGLRLSYIWTDPLGNVITTKSTSYVKADPGTTFYTLTVGDSTGLTASAQTSVTLLEDKHTSSCSNDKQR